MMASSQHDPDRPDALLIAEDCLSPSAEGHEHYHLYSVERREVRQLACRVNFVDSRDTPPRYCLLTRPDECAAAYLATSAPLSPTLSTPLPQIGLGIAPLHLSHLFDSGDVHLWVCRATYRTTSTAAIAIDEDDDGDSTSGVVDETRASSRAESITTDEDSRMHPVLDHLDGLLNVGDSCMYVFSNADNSTLNESATELPRNSYLALIRHDETDQWALLGMELATPGSGDILQVDVVFAVDHTCDIVLDGDGGLVYQSQQGKEQRFMPFRPASIRNLWDALQAILKIREGSGRDHSDWIWLEFYRNKINDTQQQLQRWTHIVPSRTSELQLIRKQQAGALQRDKGPHLDSELEQRIISKLKEIMFKSDLDTITSKQLRLQLEAEFDMDLKKYRKIIDQQMITVMGQMEPSSKIFDYLYLGTEWNASNWEELSRNNCQYIINVTCEIENFFPDKIKYCNIRVWDVPTTTIWPNWNRTYDFIRQARKAGSSVLVHCKMGVSRSASTVIAYAMKQYSWSLEEAHAFVKKRRRIIKPNEGFRTQLVMYEGMLTARRSGAFGTELDIKPPPHAPIPLSQPVTPTIKKVTPPDSPVSTPPSTPAPELRAWTLGNRVAAERGSQVALEDAGTTERERAGSETSPKQAAAADPGEMPVTEVSEDIAFRIKKYSQAVGVTATPLHSGSSGDAVAGGVSRNRPHSLHFDRDGNPTGRARVSTNPDPKVSGADYKHRTWSDRTRSTSFATTRDLADRFATQMEQSVNDCASAPAPPEATTAAAGTTTTTTATATTASPSTASTTVEAQGKSQPSDEQAASPAVQSVQPAPEGKTLAAGAAGGHELPSRGRTQSSGASVSALRPYRSSQDKSELPKPPRGFPRQHQEGKSSSSLVALDGSATGAEAKAATTRVSSAPNPQHASTADAVPAVNASPGSSNAGHSLPRSKSTASVTSIASAYAETQEAFEPLRWTSSEVVAWLEQAGLAEYGPLFAREELQGCDLLDLCNDDLKSIGIMTLHARKRILRACRALTDACAPDADTCMTSAGANTPGASAFGQS
ncbi:uncharacterized protein MONBRDRAFT_5247 [Monosiga brevicollis MX1]|uniref:protein-serine/threonine phosphatase n=1 Tax=Monosiga brevicollis TaxID=81824 RepID=A9UQE0_MONBE|nr:uncharacterized protein MONBRDRAFT_5247 [Monosiga brevicollis MX1]EDQ92582.1 predicted protein [Monosiga brevicollis MX1]|eukprot:XP_001742344.1 hypothetical protein [Monosiga brevicollis MX1]